jgi:hypothetical protein
MSLIQSETFDRGVTLELHYDDDGSHADPREYDNIGTMVCWHRRCDLGDQTVNPDASDAETMAEFIEEVTGPDAIVLPLWLYEHGSMTMSVGEANPFSCPWDSGQVGFIYCTPVDVVREYGKDTPENRERAIAYMKGEVETYDMYLRGEVYGWVVETPDSTLDDGCWGYLGDEDYVLSEGRSAAEHAVEQLKRREADAFVASLYAMLGASA